MPRWRRSRNALQVSINWSLVGWLEEEEAAEVGG